VTVTVLCELNEMDYDAEAEKRDVGNVM
ncbi:hypothetical protein A2U01_0080700, partial [Trifolium medium]|nr:hypothetical protein [Trifolium medium]